MKDSLSPTRALDHGVGHRIGVLTAQSSLACLSVCRGRKQLGRVCPLPIVPPVETEKAQVGVQTVGVPDSSGAPQVGDAPDRRASADGRLGLLPARHPGRLLRAPEKAGRVAVARLLDEVPGVPRAVLCRRRKVLPVIAGGLPRLAGLVAAEAVARGRAGLVAVPDARALQTEAAADTVGARIKERGSVPVEDAEVLRKLARRVASAARVLRRPEATLPRRVVLPDPRLTKRRSVRIKRAVAPVGALPSPSSTQYSKDFFDVRQKRVRLCDLWLGLFGHWRFARDLQRQ